jgi:hypothetical protein
VGTQRQLTSIATQRLALRREGGRKLCRHRAELATMLKQVDVAPEGVIEKLDAMPAEQAD